MRSPLRQGVYIKTSYNSITEYTEIGGDEDLPLGREFQDLVACFYSQSGSGKNKYQLADKLIQQIK